MIKKDILKPTPNPRDKAINILGNDLDKVKGQVPSMISPPPPPKKRNK